MAEEWEKRSARFLLSMLCKRQKCVAKMRRSGRSDRPFKGAVGLMSMS